MNNATTNPVPEREPTMAEKATEIKCCAVDIRDQLYSAVMLIHGEDLHREEARDPNVIPSIDFILNESVMILNDIRRTMAAFNEKIGV